MALVAIAKDNRIGYLPAHFGERPYGSIPPYFRSHVNGGSFTKREWPPDQSPFLYPGVFPDIDRTIFRIEDSRSYRGILFHKYKLFIVGDGMGIRYPSRSSMGGDQREVLDNF